MNDDLDDIYKKWFNKMEKLDTVPPQAVPRVASYRVHEDLQEFLDHCNLTTEQAIKIIKETPMDDRWKHLSEEIDNKVLRDKEQAEYAKRMEEKLQASGWYADQHVARHTISLDQPEPHWQRSDTATTYTGVSVGQAVQSTSGYVAPTPLIDNYEAYKLIEVLTEILDEVRAINKKLKKKVKK